jgi:propanol-preferring alcohol dehydrogenase
MASYKTFIIPAPGEPLELRTRSLQDAVGSLPAEGVLVKIHAAGVCHTDLHLWYGYYQVGKKKDQVVRFADRGLPYPIVPGHEIAGAVHHLGGQVQSHSDLKLGDRVLVYPWIGCDECYLCKGGDPGLCSKSRELGFIKDGGYSEFVVVPHYRYIFKTPDNITDPLAAMLPCSAVTAFSAIKKTLPTVRQVREWGVELVVVVIGLGGLGQWSLNLLKHCLDGDSDAHCMKVIGVDVNKEKIDHALQSNLVDEGFHITFVGEQAPMAVTQEAERFLAHFGGNRVHVILDFANTTETFQFSTSVLHRAGTLVLIGLHGGLGEVKLPEAVLSMYAIIGSYTGSLLELAELIDVVSKHPFPAPPPVQPYKLEDANKALNDLDKGLILGRAVLKPEH